MPPPPQSMSVSEPFLTPSSQVGAAHSLAWVPSPRRAAAPVAAACPTLLPPLPSPQRPPALVAGLLPPPQSTSVSLAFLIVSPQLGATQCALRHTPPTQSVASTQPPPT